MQCKTPPNEGTESRQMKDFKLGGDKLIADGARTLNALAEIIDTKRMKAPAFKMVLTGVGDLAYRRTDGVYVVPIGCLKNETKTPLPHDVAWGIHSSYLSSWSGFWVS